MDGDSPQAGSDGEDAGGDEPEMEGPERRCIVTGAVRPKGELLRFVVSPGGEVVPDLGERLPGRGIWLCASRDVVNTAVAKRLFARAARRAAVVPADLADRLEVLLARRCLDALGLARRAGQAVCGYEKVRAELKARRAAVLVEARDAAEGGSGKMKALASGLPVVALFDAVELGPIFGRDAAVHASLAPGGLARRLLEDARLLSGFRPGVVAEGMPTGP